MKQATTGLFASTNAVYTTPVVCKTDPKDWFVYFEFIHAGTLYERKLRKGINRFPDLKERQKEADALKEATLTKLKMGWNPIIDPKFTAQNLVLSTDLTKMAFNEAMDYAFEAKKKKKELSKKSIQDYRNILNIVKPEAVNVGLAFMPVRMVTRLHIITLLDSLYEKREMSGHRYNIYLGVIRSMFTALETRTIVDFNPACKIPKMEVAESTLYASYTDEEKIRISEHLAVHHYRLFAFMQVIYQTGIRPKELLALRIKDIDLKRRVITLHPDFEEETTKTNAIRQPIISNALYPFIKEMNLDQLPGEFFVFGSPFEPGKGNRGSERIGTRASRKGMNLTHGTMGAMRSDFLAPSPYHTKRDTVGRLWQRLVKDEVTGLGINKCLYAAKHTGGDDKILAGIDLDTLRNQYGHKNIRMTERYVKRLQETRNSQLIEMSPAFLPKTGKVRRIAS